MTRLQIQIIQNSFLRIKSKNEVSGNFHDFLFTLDPAFRPLFPADRGEQDKNFLLMLKFIVESLDRIYIFAPSLEAYGLKISQYGLKPQQYQIIGAAFILALRQSFGAEITIETETAWLRAYATIFDAMRTVPAKQKSLARVTGQL